MNNNKKYKADLPYPKVLVNRKNKNYAKLISDDFAGINSEMTAITQYIAYYLVLKDNNEEVAHDLIEISKVEMFHLELLGQAIIALGCNPVYGHLKKNKLSPWTGNAVTYAYDVKSIVLLSIQGEKDAIIQYENHIKEINDNNIRELLYRIIIDEKIHIKVLTNLYDKYC